MIGRISLWLRSILFRSRLEREMQEEMSAHLHRTVERFVAEGMSPDAARTAARREFGNVAAIKDEARDARGGRGIETGRRSALRHPLPVAHALLCPDDDRRVRAGLGCNAVLFLFISSNVNSPLPGMTRDDSLVRIRGIERRPGINLGREFSYPEYRDYAAQTTLFAAVAAWTSSDVVLGVSGNAVGPDEVLISGAATYVTANYFDVMGARPIRGAGLPSSVPDHGGEPPLTAVISHSVWER